MRKGLFACALLALFAAIPPSTLAGEEDSADSYFESEGSGVEIRSEPSGAEVYLNGVLRGKTPLSLTGVLPGAQRIALEKEGYWPRKVVLAVPGGKRLEVRLKLTAATGFLRIEPPTADGVRAPLVLIDGELGVIGDNEVAEGLHTVRLRAFGFEDRTISVFVRRGERESVDFNPRPSPFRVDSLKAGRRRFNPSNPGLLGTTVLSFRASAPGTASIVIRKEDGEPVATAELPEFAAWEQSFSWSGKTSDGAPLPDGAYIATVTARPTASLADGKAVPALQTGIVIDSGIDVRPAAVSGDIGGLFFAPEARTIPSGSFQIDGTVLFGKPLGEAAFGAPPFALGMRFAPFDRLEVVGTLTAVVSKDADNAIAFGASVKRALSTPSERKRLGVAAAVRWTYAKNTGPSPFGNPPGLEASAPIELFIAGTSAGIVSVHAVPSFLWGGAEGAPDGTAPKAAAAGGISLRSQSYTAAFSARSAADAVSMAAEARFFPRPSVLVLSVLAGGWISEDSSGLFAGAGLGIIY